MDPIVEALKKAKEHINPVLELADRLEGREILQLTALERLSLTAEIEKAMEKGEAELESVNTAIGKLKSAQPIPAPFVPKGF